MSEQDAPPFPTLTPASTVEGALADLAGAVQIVAALLIEENAPGSYMSFTLFAALRQWQDSGFAQDAAQRVAEEIAVAIIARE